MRAIIEWLLSNATPPATTYMPQVQVARVTGHCTCGCPTINLGIPDGTPKGDLQTNLMIDAIGEVNGDMVGIMLFQAGGDLTCLEIYDLSDIKHPYDLPDVNTLRLFETTPA